MLWQQSEVRRLGEINVYDALENWARWHRRNRDCFPADYVTNWQMIDSVEYKNSYETTEEKLERAMEHKEPDGLQAAKVEAIVLLLWERKRPLAAAIRIHYITCPEKDRYDLGLTAEQWVERQARWATRRGGWYFSPDMYREAVEKATDEIEAAL